MTPPFKKEEGLPKTVRSLPGDRPACPFWAQMPKATVFIFQVLAGLLFSMAAKWACPGLYRDGIEGHLNNASPSMRYRGRYSGWCYCRGDRPGHGHWRDRPGHSKGRSGMAPNRKNCCSGHRRKRHSSRIIVAAASGEAAFNDRLLQIRYLEFLLLLLHLQSYDPLTSCLTLEGVQSQAL